MENKEKLLVEVAKMYYYYGYNQKKISEIMDLSRAYVCQLLESARREGIVEIKVRDYSSDDKEMEDCIRQTYGLQSVRIFKNQEYPSRDKMIDTMAEEISRLVAGKVSDGDTIAFSWGNTLYRISQQFKMDRECRDIKVIPLSGGMSDIRRNIYVSEISTNLARAFHGTPYVIPLPVLVENRAIRDSIYTDSGVASLLEMGSRADIAIFTVGNPSEDNIMFQSGFIDKNDLKHLKKNGLVGDLCTHFMDKDGEICDREFDERTISISLENMRMIPLKICVVFDVSKALILQSVLKKGYVDYLFVDEATVHLMNLTGKTGEK